MRIRIPTATSAALNITESPQVAAARTEETANRVMDAFPSRRQGFFARVAAACGAVASMLGCASNEQSQINIPIASGPAPIYAVTQVEDALRCLAERYPPSADLRIGVNDLTDGTGTTLSGDTFSKALTQRPDMMMTIALAKTGARVVNRSSTGVSEWELKQAMQKYIGDGRSRVNPASKEPIPYRPVLAGSVLGSTHYISGAISELNWNLSSDVSEYGVGGFTFGKRNYRISIGVDLIVTDTTTTEIVLARSYSKQLVGSETSAGLFRFFDVGRASKNFGPKEVFEFNLGKQANEPVQTAVRWILETAAFEIVSTLSGVGGGCDAQLPLASRPTRAALAAGTAARGQLARRPEGTPPGAPATGVGAHAGTSAGAGSMRGAQAAGGAVQASVASARQSMPANTAPPGSGVAPMMLQPPIVPASGPGAQSAVAPASGRAALAAAVPTGAPRKPEYAGRADAAKRGLAGGGSARKAELARAERASRTRPGAAVTKRQSREELALNQRKRGTQNATKTATRSEARKSAYAEARPPSTARADLAATRPAAAQGASDAARDAERPSPAASLAIPSPGALAEPVAPIPALPSEGSPARGAGPTFAPSATEAQARVPGAGALRSGAGAVPMTAAAGGLSLPTNIIEGVNLIEDDDETVIRVDLRVPLDSLPAVDASRPKTLTINLPRVANGIGKILNLSGAGVEAIRLEAESGTSRLVIDLTAALEHEVQKNGRSLLVVLKGTEAAKSAAVGNPTGDPANRSGTAPAAAPTTALTGPDAGSVGKSDELARTRNTEWLSQEQILQSRRR